ncbi:MAG TPA: N-acetylmuramoyl-L-alanine amidase [Solirubrobacteraceae bacterium]|jgi:hypothetical protein
MALDPITRRHALGAAALAAGALAPSAAAASRRAALFELDLDEHGARGATASAAAAGWRTTPVLRAPRRFDLIGLRWARGHALEAQVRARRRGGEWTPWVALHRHGDHAPDSGSRIAGTEPAWTNTADEFQLRLRGSARGLRARFVRAKPTASVARAVTSRLRRRSAARASASASRARPGGARPSQSGPPPPRIITRSEWGGDSVPPRAAAEYGDVQLAFCHHTVTANDYTPEESASIVLGIAKYHRDSNGWNDIGYNFLVDKYGQVFEGRAGGMELAVIGAQAQGYNSHSTGVASLGDFRAIGQSEQGLAALAQLLAWKLSIHGIPSQGEVTVTSAGGETNRYRSGTPVTFQRISGHRDGDSTTCPGDALYAQLPELRDRVAGQATAAPAATSALTARAVTPKVRYPGTVKLDGQLRFAGGQSPAGAPLTIEYQPAGNAAWEPVGSATCAPDGRWSAELPLRASGLVRARFAGDDERPPLDGAPVAVSVVPTLALQVSTRRLRRRRSVRITGTLDPRPPGGRVLCMLERQAGSRWVVVQRKRINVRRGGFRTAVRPRVAGLYRVTISTPGATKRLRLRVTA